MLYQMQNTLGLYLHTCSRGDYQPVSFIHSKVKSTLDLYSALATGSPCRDAPAWPGLAIANFSCHPIHPSFKIHQAQTLDKDQEPNY